MLTLTNVTDADAGTYQVVVLNNDGTAASAPATLFIPDADTDGDGLPNGDGMTNLQEFIAGTDPQDPASYLKVDAVKPTGSSNGFTIQFNAVAKKTYSVLYADAVPTNFWVKLQDIAAVTTNRVATVTNSNVSASRRFYRLITPAQ